MPRYKALARLAFRTGIVEPDTEFESDLVPGDFWKPLDKEAKAAVKARDVAAQTEAEPFVHIPGSDEPDPRIADLEAKLVEADDLAKLRDDEISELTSERDALASEVDDLKAAIAKFDPDGDGKPGGGKPKPTE